MTHVITFLPVFIGFVAWLIGLFRVKISGPFVSYCGAIGMIAISGLICMIAASTTDHALSMLGFEGMFPAAGLFLIGLVGIIFGTVGFLITFFTARAMRRSGID